LNAPDAEDPGLETQPWADISERLRRSEFLCKARAILNNLEGPTLPFVLLDLCRQYARVKYRQWAPEKWPMWLRASEETTGE
jgi:hypothetical protein